MYLNPSLISIERKIKPLTKKFRNSFRYLFYFNFPLRFYPAFFFRFLEGQALIV